jgi:hypothetical protein
MMVIGTPVTGPDGTEYPSRRAAARALGVNIHTIGRHLREHGNLNLINSWPVPCTWQGRHFPSLQAAAEVIGVRRHTLSHHLAKHGNLDLAGKGPRSNVGNRGYRVPFRFGPHYWPRRIDAAADLGMSTSTLRRISRPSSTPAQRDRLLAAVMAYEARQRGAAA